MNGRILKARMVASGVSCQTLAHDIGISVSSLYKKMRGSSQFMQGEISAIARTLGLDGNEIFEIFFAEKVS